MNPFFALEVSICRRSANNHGRLSDSSPFVVGSVNQFGGITVLVSPSGVHAQKHLCPVIGIQPSLARMYRKYGSAFIHRTAQQRLQLQLLNGNFKLGHFGFNLQFYSRVFVDHAHELRQIFTRPYRAAQWLDYRAKIL